MVRAWLPILALLSLTASQAAFYTPCEAPFVTSPDEALRAISLSGDGSAAQRQLDAVRAAAPVAVLLVTIDATYDRRRAVDFQRMVRFAVGEAWARTPRRRCSDQRGDGGGDRYGVIRAAGWGRRVPVVLTTHGAGTSSIGWR